MGTFNAAEAVEALDFDLNPYVDAKGAVPEPTDKQVQAFYARLGNGLRDVTGEDLDVTDPVAVAKVMANVTEEQLGKMSDAMLDAHAEVCGAKYDPATQSWSGGHPTREQIEQLPYRVRQAFYGHLQGWLNPEASGPATRR